MKPYLNLHAVIIKDVNVTTSTNHMRTPRRLNANLAINANLPHLQLRLRHKPPLPSLNDRLHISSSRINLFRRGRQSLKRLTRRLGA